MNHSYGDSRFAVGASILLHLAIVGFLCVSAGAPSMGRRPETVIQIRLADGKEFDPTYAENKSQTRPRPKKIKSVSRPVHLESPGTTESDRPQEPEPAPGQHAEEDGDSAAKDSTEASTIGHPPPEISAEAVQGEGGGNSEDRIEQIDRFLREVRTSLEKAKRYPWLARIQGQEGTAQVQFVIDSTGAAIEIRLLESSRSIILDQEAVETVRRVGRFHPPASWNNNIHVRVPMVFELNRP